MNAKKLLLVPLTAAVIFAQSDQKFQLYGFADMTITKYFLKEHSGIRNVDKMDERATFAFDHLNLYQEYKPNDRIRFLTEFSYQDKPVYQHNVNEMHIRIPAFFYDTIYTQGKMADSNQTVKGIVKYEWGSFSVERAQMFVNVDRYINLTFGKFITPAGIWNVDHGSPVIMTVNQPSQYTFREMYPKSQLGLMESGTMFIGDGDLTYNLYLSTGRGNPVVGKFGDLAGGGQLRLNLPVLSECNIGLSGYTGIQSVTTRVMNMDMTFIDATNFTTANNIVDTRLFKYRENVFGLDFRIRQSIVMLQAELNYQHVTNKMRDDSASSILATYILGSVDAYKTTKFLLTPYAYWELVQYSDTKNNPSLFSSVVPETAPTAKDPYMFNGYMKFMAGINMKILANFGIKTEFNFTRILQADTRAGKDPNENQEDKDGLNDVPGVTTQFYIAF